MDRRVISGLACFAIVACGEFAPARSQEAVSPPPAKVPTAATSATGVGFAPVDSIRDSINAGSTLTPVPGLRRPIAKPGATGRTVAPSRPGILPPKSDPATVPSTLVDGADLVPAATTQAATPAGRPAPYAKQAPATARLQADPVATSAGGRPAPYAREVPTSPRPQFPAPRPVAVEPPGEAVPPPALEPVSPRAELTPPPSLDPVAPGAEGPPEPPTVAVAPAPKAAVDLDFVPASMVDATAMRSTAKAKAAPVASRRAASVGDEVITMHELELAVNETIQRYGQGQKPDRETLNRIAAQVLDTMIEETLITHEAKRKMSKSAKSQTMFNDYAERKFREEELTPMLRKTASANEYELNNKLLAESGRSVNDLREAFRRRLTAKEFLWNEIKTKVSADVSEMRRYHADHLANFDRPAQVSWREVEVDIRKSPDRATARKKADAALDRLRRGEDFAAVARSASDGATAKQGGLWETTPGGFADPVVNAALDQLPIGQASQILEGPTSFRVVRVDARREAGPARFDEVQDQVRNAVFERNFDKARDNYIKALRKVNPVVTIFDQTASDPALTRRADATAAPASGR